MCRIPDWQCHIQHRGAAHEGISLETQTHKIAAWAGVLDGRLRLAAEYAGISCEHIRNGNGLRGAIEATFAEEAVLVVYSLSRLSRSTREALRVD